MGLLIELQKVTQISEILKWGLSSIISEIIFAYIDIFIFTNLLKIKTNKKQRIIFVFTDAVLRILGFFLIPIPYYRAFNIIITIVLFKIILKPKIEKCIVGEVINAITIICIEVIVSKVLCQLFAQVDTYKDGIYMYSYNTSLMLSISFFRIIICYIIKKKKLEINMSNNLSPQNRHYIIIISGLGCLLIYLNALEMMLYITNFPYSIFLVNIGSLVIYFYMAIKSVVRISKLEEQDMKIKSLESYNRTLQIMYDSIRGFRHDFSNFIQGLYGYATSENIEEVKKMCKSILKDCQNVNNMGILDPKVINNPAIYSIITNKYYIAKQKNINMSIEVMIDLKEIKMESYELCRILGILLDNALEASGECKEKIVNVRFVKDANANRKLVIVENSYNKGDIDVDKIFEKGYSTKKDTNNEHGLGLWTVRKILSKSRNLNLFTTATDVFCQQLEIYD